MGIHIGLHGHPEAEVLAAGQHLASLRLDDRGFDVYGVVVPEGRWHIRAAWLILESSSGLGGTLQVRACTPGQSMTQGVAQLVTPLPLDGPADTVVMGTLIAAPTVVQPGDRVAVTFGGIVTGLRGLVTLLWQRVS